MEDSRITWLRSLGARIGSEVFFGPDVYVEHDFAPLLTIEDGVVLARGVSIILHDSSLNNVLGAPLKFGRIILRKECYIGANTTILCGVEIGTHAIVGAASLVTHSIPDRMVAYGQPARVHGTIEELAAKQAAPQDEQRWHYLPFIPWRDRLNSVAQDDQQILRFIDSIADLPLPRSSHPLHTARTEDVDEA
ncbi:MAG: hypothetical protein Fur005_22600 [Roseiflexaceae bacterium]